MKAPKLQAYRVPKMPTHSTSKRVQLRHGCLRSQVMAVVSTSNAAVSGARSEGLLESAPGAFCFGNAKKQRRGGSKELTDSQTSKARRLGRREHEARLTCAEAAFPSDDIAMSIRQAVTSRRLFETRNLGQPGVGLFIATLLQAS